MALIKCPECGNDCSDQADTCPKCGYPLKKKETAKTTAPKEVKYKTQVVKIRIWGRSSEKLNEKLAPYVAEGWEVTAMVEDPWMGGVASPVYKVTMRKKIN